MSLPPANWYTDPRDSASLRYWDGTAWTGHTQPTPQATLPPTPQPTPQAAFQPTPQATFEPTRQATFEPTPQATFEPTPQPLAPVAPQSTQSFDAIGGRGLTPGVGHMMTPGFGDLMTPGFGSGAATYSSPGPLSPQRSRRGLWLGLGVGGALVLAVVVILVVVVLPKFAGLSSDYSGAPVTSADVASAGNQSVISTSETVAVEIPAGWHAVQEYVDLQSAVGTLPTGATLLGAWFTGAPGTTTVMPNMVMVMEMTPAAVGPGTMDDMRNQYLAGMKSSLPSLVLGESQDYATALGLEGDRTDATFAITEQNLSGTMAVVAVAHGRRFVLVIWTSYDGSIDEQSFKAFMSALRVDA